MPTPTFKLLRNALRLGQPQDPQASIFALVEAITAQQETIDELRQRLTVLTSHTQILEAKSARLEAELAGLVANGAGPAPASSSYTPPYTRGSDSVPPPAAPQHAQLAQQHAQQVQQHAQQQLAQQQAQQQAQAQHSPYQPPDPERLMRAQGSEGPASYGPPAVPSPNHRRPPSMPPPAPPPSTPPAYPPVREGSRDQSRRQRLTPQMSRSRGRQPVVDAEEDSSDDFKVETIVVHKKDLESLRRPEAPFRIAPPGAAMSPARGSIPGAPWARGARTDVQVRPAVSDEFTIDAPAHDPRDEGDDEGETYRDGGASPTLARALGLSPHDPRLSALRRGHGSDEGEDNLTPLDDGSSPDEPHK